MTTPPRADNDDLSGGALAGVFYTGFAAAGLLVFKPLIVGALIDDYGLSAGQAGLIAGTEMFGIGAAALMVVAMIGPRSRRGIAKFGAVLGLIGCLGPSLWHTYPALAGWRLLAGVGTGLMAPIVLSRLGTTRNPDRTFALYFVFNYLLAALAFPWLPTVIERYGASGAYLALGALLAGALFLREEPAAPPQSVLPVARDTPPFPLRMAAMSLGVSLAYWIGNGAIWAFIERLGLQASLDAQQVAAILSAGQLASIAGAVTAAVLHTRAGRARPLFGTISLSVLSLLLIASSANGTAFTVGALLFCFVWSSFLAYLNGLMSAQDSAGRVVALSVSSQTLGMAIGPAVAGGLADAVGYGAVVMLALACHATALVLLIALLQVRSRMAQSSGVPVTRAP